jgi:hypothetical protein
MLTFDCATKRFGGLAAIAALVVIGGRVYTRAILHTGPLLSLGEALSAGATAGARPMRSGPGRP